MVDGMSKGVNTDDNIGAKPVAGAPRRRATDGRAQRWDAHRAGKRAELVDAAVRAIEEFGPEVRTAVIAATAGVPRPHLYRHFSGAGDLRSAVVDQILGSYLDALIPVWRPRGTPREMLRAAIGGHLGWVTAHPALYRYALRDPAGQSAAATARGTVSTRIETIVAGFLTGQALDSSSAGPLAAGVTALVDGATTRWLDGPDGIGAEDFTSRLCDWTWAIFDTAFRAASLTLDPDAPLPRG
jgi:AcrR family transcriptional regulator